MNVFPVYVHVEKCGGMSLHHALRYAIPGYQILKPWWYWSNDPSNYITGEELARFMKLHPGVAGIGGHTTRTHAGYEQFISKPIIYFTFLRDPISRYLSHLNHQVNKMGINWSVDDYLRESRFSNFMTSRVAGSNDVELAKDRLQKEFSFVGVFEKFDESIVLLSQLMFGAPNGLHYEHMNDSDSEAKICYMDLTESQRSMVKENNLLDVELYRFAKEVLFSRSVESFPGSFHAEVEKFSAENNDFQFNPWKWWLLRLGKAYSERLPQRVSHRLSN